MKRVIRKTRLTPEEIAKYDLIIKQVEEEFNVSPPQDRSMPKITGSIEKDALDVKRLYLKGLILEDECPLCKSKVENDFGDETGYLSYPTPGSPEPVFLYCEDCDHEWAVKVVLDISLKLF